MKTDKTLVWDLEQLLQGKSFDELYQETDELAAKTSDFLKTLSPVMSVEDFKAFVSFDELLEEKLSRLSGYSGLKLSVDQKDSVAKLQESRLEDLFVKHSKISRKISFWLRGKKVEGLESLDDENAKRLFSSIPDLEFNFWYDRKTAKYSLSESEENIVLNKDISGIKTLNDLRDLIETEFEYMFKPKGSNKAKKFKTRAEISKFWIDKNRDFRVESYKQVLSKFKDNIDKFFAVYQSVVKNDNFETELRGYDSVLSSRNISNQVPDKAIEVLMQVCAKNTHIFQRYFKFKQKELGLEKMTRFDIYAPLEGRELKFDMTQTIELTLTAFNEFTPQFSKFARQIIDEKHIHSHPTPKKVSGAFCSTLTPSITPYVLLNHTSQLKDVFTFAHELGHGIHSLYAQNHSIFSQHAGLPLAETASTFGEMLLFDKILSQTQDKTVIKSILADKLTDSYQTVMRQNFFVIFEQRAHEEFKKGITCDQLCQLWLNTLHEQFNDSVEVDDLFKYEWAYVTHLFHTPFYCYAYSFGDLLTLSLYSRYKQEGKSFVPKIEKILASGGSEDPTKILAELDMDILLEEFWQNGFNVIEGWMNQLENL